MTGSDSPSTPFAPYTPRHTRCLGVRTYAGLALKVYVIERPGHTAPEVVIDAALDCAKTTLPREAEREGHHHGLGFVILHAGAHANWLLLDWWAHGEICCQHLARSKIADPLSFTPCARPYSACVWEGLIVSHEHRAWIRTMLTENPDPARYLADQLEPGAY